MKRFHIHISVDDISVSTGFYSALFGQPVKQKPDYAKWILDTPPLSIAISSKCCKEREAGIHHIGIQVDSSGELDGLRELAEGASKNTLFDQGDVECCYAKSEKHWVIDPQGVAWEYFLTKSDV